MALFTREGLRFLYRTDEGTVSRSAWWSGLAPLASLLLATTAIWFLVAPWGKRGLDQRAFLDPLTVVSYLYLMVYTLAIFLIAISYTMLSAKRFRARGRPAPLALAGLLPLAALFAGAAHWLYPQVSDAMPYWPVAAADMALLAVALWHIGDLGLASE